MVVLAAVASTIVSAGVSESIGAVVSYTPTIKVLEAVLPAASAALQGTVVELMAKSDSDAGVQLTSTTPSTRSVAVGEAYVTVVLAAVASTIVSAGVPESTGASVSGGVRSHVSLSQRRTAMSATFGSNPSEGVPSALLQLGEHCCPRLPPPKTVAVAEPNTVSSG